MAQWTKVHKVAGSSPAVSNVLCSWLRWQGPLMPDLPQVSLFIIYQNIKRFSIGSCNKIFDA